MTRLKDAEGSKDRVAYIFVKAFSCKKSIGFGYPWANVSIVSSLCFIEHVNSAMVPCGMACRHRMAMSSAWFFRSMVRQNHVYLG